MFGLLTAIEAQILSVLLSEIETLAEVPDDCLKFAGTFITGLVNTGVLVNAQHFLGHPPTPAERMRCSRAIRRMAERGLVVRVADSTRDRAKYLQLTAVGFQEAVRRAGSSLDHQALHEGLRRLHWGRHLLEAIANFPCVTS